MMEKGKKMRKTAIWLAAFLVLPTAAFAESAQPARVSYLGPEGTYTEEAAQFWFQSDEELIRKNVTEVCSG